MKSQRQAGRMTTLCIHLALVLWHVFGMRAWFRGYEQAMALHLRDHESKGQSFYPNIVDISVAVSS